MTTAVETSETVLNYFQAQSEFIKLHKDQFDKFIVAQKKDAETTEEETTKKFEEMRIKMTEEHKIEKQKLTAAHAEEVR